MNRKIFAVNQRGYRVGESHHRAKLSDADVMLILDLRAAGLSYRAIAAKWDDGVTLSVSTVRDICLGRIRAQIPDRFKGKPGG
jgi:hypothetical protein